MDPQDSEGRTPLHFAAAYCSQEIMQVILSSKTSAGITQVAKRYINNTSYMA